MVQPDVLEIIQKTDSHFLIKSTAEIILRISHAFRDIRKLQRLLEILLDKVTALLADPGHFRILPDPVYGFRICMDHLPVQVPQRCNSRYFFHPGYIFPLNVSRDTHGKTALNGGLTAQRDKHDDIVPYQSVLVFQSQINKIRGIIGPVILSGILFSSGKLLLKIQENLYWKGFNKNV